MVAGSNPFVGHEDCTKAVNRSNDTKFGGPKSSSDTFRLSYSFRKPILFKGYKIKTANDNPDRDPKDWII